MKHSWNEAGICKSCGESAHVTFCPKPTRISKAKWQKMNDDQRIAVERKTEKEK